MNEKSDKKNLKEPIATQMTRRAALARSAAGATALACGLAGCATRVKTPGTTPKMEALYQDRPNGLLRCGLCAHFIAPSACEIVAGPVQADGWCRYYDLFVFHLT